MGGGASKQKKVIPMETNAAVQGSSPSDGSQTVPTYVASIARHAQNRNNTERRPLGRAGW
jgi:hypothetical protein